MCEIGFWQVGIVRNVVFLHSFAESPARKVSSEKRGGAEYVSKICTTHCGARGIRKPKQLKTGCIGALLEVQLRRICTTLWRQSDLEARILTKFYCLNFKSIESQIN